MCKPFIIQMPDPQDSIKGKKQKVSFNKRNKLNSHNNPTSHKICREKKIKKSKKEIAPP